MKQGKVIVMSAPSGSGKTTIYKELFKRLPQLKFSVSATTRAMRTGEQDGKDYFFLSREEFNRRIAAGEFLEHETFFGNEYGTLKTVVDNVVTAGDDILLDVEVKGAMNIKRIYGTKALLVFIEPPSLAELERRLRTRGTESEASIKTRLERAAFELSFANQFDNRVTNDDVQRATSEVEQLIRNFTAA
jgi:guanylate kinase